MCFYLWVFQLLSAEEDTLPNKDQSVGTLQYCYFWFSCVLTCCYVVIQIHDYFQLREFWKNNFWWLNLWSILEKCPECTWEECVLCCFRINVLHIPVKSSLCITSSTWLLYFFLFVLFIIESGVLMPLLFYSSLLFP